MLLTIGRGYSGAVHRSAHQCDFRIEVVVQTLNRLLKEGVISNAQGSEQGGQTCNCTTVGQNPLHNELERNRAHGQL